MSEVTIKSSIIYPKIITGNATLSILDSGDSQEFIIEEIYDINTPYNVFFKIDDDDYLFNIPIFQVSSDPPQWVSVTKSLGITAFYLISGNSPGSGEQVGSHSLIISVVNAGDMARTVHLTYFMYQDRLA